MNLAIDRDKKQNKPHIVEVVGPAGAGKTTLCNVLSRCDGIRLSNFPDVRHAESFPFFARYGLQTLAAITLAHPGNLKELGRRQLAWLSILNGWPTVLQREIQRSNDLLVLDQGPVYLLSEMKLFGPHFLKTKRAKGLWQSWYQRWAATLNAIVWLDAPDACLYQRIQSREKDHIVKDEAPQAVFQFLKEYRRAYQQTFASLTANRTCLHILRFDTSRQTPEEIAAQLCCEFNTQAIPSTDC